VKNKKDKTMRWREIFTEVTEDNGYYECGKVNFYNIASLFEDLYVRIDELEEKIKMNEHAYLSNPLLTEYRDSNFPNKDDMGEEQPLYKSVISYETKESDWNDFWEEK